jgi:hypothetical protein
MKGVGIAALENPGGLLNEDSSARSISLSSSCLRYPILKVECWYHVLLCTVCAKDCIGQLGLIHLTIRRSKGQGPSLD